VQRAGGQTALTIEQFGPTAAAYLSILRMYRLRRHLLTTPVDERDVIQNENGWAGVFLTRNEDLISSGPLGPNRRSRNDRSDRYQIEFHLPDADGPVHR